MRNQSHTSTVFITEELVVHKFHDPGSSEVKLSGELRDVHLPGFTIRLIKDVLVAKAKRRWLTDLSKPSYFVLLTAL